MYINNNKDLKLEEILTSLYCHAIKKDDYLPILFLIRNEISIQADNAYHFTTVDFGAGKIELNIKFDIKTEHKATRKNSDGSDDLFIDRDPQIQGFVADQYDELYGENAAYNAYNGIKSIKASAETSVTSMHTDTPALKQRSFSFRPISPATKSSSASSSRSNSASSKMFFSLQLSSCWSSPNPSPSPSYQEDALEQIANLNLAEDADKQTNAARANLSPKSSKLSLN